MAPSQRLSKEDQENFHLWAPFWQRVATGENDLAQYSDEEILTGRFKLMDGREAPQPKAYPQRFKDEQVKRGFRQAEEKIRKGAQKALDVYSEIMEDSEASTADRLRAAAFFTDRFLGKAPEQIKVAQVDRVEELFGRLFDREDAFLPADDA